jgi:hypothetical protein
VDLTVHRSRPVEERKPKKKPLEKKTSVEKNFSKWIGHGGEDREIRIAE